MLRSLGGILGATALLVLAACEGDAPLTELVVVVDSDLTVPGELDAVHLAVVAPGGTRYDRTVSLAAADGIYLPLSLGVQHTEGALEPVTVTAEGMRGSDVVVTTRAITGWVKGESRLLRLVLSRDCLGRSCLPDQTCEGGACVSAAIPPGSLPAFQGVIPSLDASTPIDGGPDGGTDSGTPACLCRDSRDVCDGFACYRADYTCNALNPCETGYTCSEGLCRCMDETVCGITCTDTPCPDHLSCDEAAGLCRDPLACIFRCGAEDVCSYGELTFEVALGRCAPPGSLGVGAECTAHRECESGRCDGICLAPCMANRDCPDGQGCGWQSSVGLVCMVSACGASELCDVSEACIGDACAVVCGSNADCAATEVCAFGWTVPVCRAGMRSCGETDIEASEMTGASACVLDQGCWDDAQCPREYTCTEVGAGLGIGARLCAR